MPDGPRGPSAEDEVFERLEAERVAAAIAALPEDQRRVIVLRDMYGYSGKRVADSLGLSVPAMKSRLHRGRTSLRADLADRRV